MMVWSRPISLQYTSPHPGTGHPYQPMPTPRVRPAVLMCDIWLLVAGGCDASWTDLAIFELYNTSTNQWLAASSLPTPCGYLTSAIVDTMATSLLTVSKYSVSPSLTLYHKLLTSPLLASHPHFGVGSLTLH